MLSVVHNYYYLFALLLIHSLRTSMCLLIFIHAFRHFRWPGGRGQLSCLFRGPHQVQGHFPWPWNLIYNPQNLLYLSGRSWFQFSMRAATWYWSLEAPGRQAANIVCIHEWSKIQYVNKSIVKRSLIGLLRWVIGPLVDLSGFHCSYDIGRWQRKYQLSNDHKILKCFGN